MFIAVLQRIAPELRERLISSGALRKDELPGAALESRQINLPIHELVCR
jgi:hypothetical protein